MLVTDFVNGLLSQTFSKHSTISRARTGYQWLEVIALGCKLNIGWASNTVY